MRSSQKMQLKALGGERNGCFTLETRVITVREGIAVNMRVKALVHELAHACCGRSARRETGA